MLFLFEGFDNISKCEIDLLGKVVIATQLPISDMPGTSITNAAETVAKAVCDKYAIKYTELIWIEHYKEDDIDIDDYKLVKFDIKNEILSNPNWKKISLKTLADIIKTKSGYEYLDKFIIESRKRLELNFKSRAVMLQAICQHTHRKHPDEKEECWACGKIVEQI